MSSRITALYALKGAGGRWLRFVGAVDQLPVRPLWDECFSYEDWQGRARPETEQLCRRLGVDVLFLIHVQKNARGALLHSRLFLVSKEMIRGISTTNP